MMGRQPRIEPATEPYPKAVGEQLRRWMPPETGFDPLILFRTICRNVPLAEAMHPLGSFQLSTRSSLTVRQRELIINRTSARLGAGYEWGVHATIYGAAAGFDEAELLATAEAGVSELWGEEEALLIAVVDQLVDSATISDETWAGLAKRFDDLEILELLVLCGWYHAIGFVLNGVGVELEPWARTPPDHLPDHQQASAMD